MTTSTNLKAIQRVLISVSDKTGIVEFARQLADNNIEILSTGGTCKLLAENNIAVREVSDVTQFPEMMDGRVKTLHPKIHGGILGRRGKDDKVMAEHDIVAIDMVVVNLYPFSQTVTKPDCDLPTAIENIDIGGPTMVRAAAKNFKDVAIVVNAGDYPRILETMAANEGALPESLRFNLSVAAFEHTASYDGAIANYLTKQLASHDNHADKGNNEPLFGRSIHLSFNKQQDLRYGENPHQSAAFYTDANSDKNSFTISNCQQLMGKALSFNNINDGNAAIETVMQFQQNACVIVKHANPCGVAVKDIQLEAYQRAYNTDSESAFGGIIAFNQPLQTEVAECIIQQQFVELIIAPSIEPGVLDILSSKENVRLLVHNHALATSPQTQQWDYKRVSGGLLVQQADIDSITGNDCRVVSQRQPTSAEIQDMLFAWKVAKMVKSNAIVYAKDLRTIGVGAGQMSRVNSARIAAIKAEHANLSVAGSVMASDAFFPFRDAIDNAASIGIECIIQPGGSMRDTEVVDAANEHNMVMLYTAIRHFNH